MKNYSILVICLSGYHGHVIEFVNNLKKTNPLVNITLAIAGKLDGKNEGYLSDGIKTIVFKEKRHLPLVFDKVFKGLYFYIQFILLWLKGGVDIVDIHFATGSIKPFMPLLRLVSKNIVITPWGSDVLRVKEEKDVRKLQTIYSYAKYVTCSPETQLGRCLVTSFRVNPEKLVKLAWGGEFFDYIQENSNNITTNNAKEYFGLTGKYVITCGYNAQKGQQHEEIINAIFKVKDRLPEKLTLLFPFTYGRSKESDLYIESIKAKCEELGLKYVAIMDHLDMPTLFKLRMATDIFVHVQTTDAGSRCVAEYVLCNKKIVHGAWMKYPYLEDNKPLCYFPVENLEQLGDCIVKAFQTEIGDLPEQVRSILLERGWKHKMAFWNDFFESLI